MESVDKRIRSISKNAKSGDKEAKQELLLLEKIISNLKIKFDFIFLIDSKDG